MLVVLVETSDREANAVVLGAHGAVTAVHCSALSVVGAGLPVAGHGAAPALVMVAVQTEVVPAK